MFLFLFCCWFLFAQELFHLSLRFCCCFVRSGTVPSLISFLFVCCCFRSGTLPSLTWIFSPFQELYGLLPWYFFLCLGHVVFYFDFFLQEFRLNFLPVLILAYVCFHIFLLLTHAPICTKDVTSPPSAIKQRKMTHCSVQE